MIIAISWPDWLWSFHIQIISVIPVDFEWFSIQWLSLNDCIFILNPFFTDSSVSTGCCATLDHIVTYLFQQLQKASKSNDAQKEVEKHPALKIIDMQPNILQQVCFSYPTKSSENPLYKTKF